MSKERCTVIQGDNETIDLTQEIPDRPSTPRPRSVYESPKPNYAQCKMFKKKPDIPILVALSEITGYQLNTKKSAFRRLPK